MKDLNQMQARTPDNNDAYLPTADVQKNPNCEYDTINRSGSTVNILNVWNERREMLLKPILH